MLCKVFFVISAFSNNAWNCKLFVNGRTESEGRESQRNTARGAFEKSESVLGKELQYVAEIHKKLQNSSGCNDVAVLNVTFDSERWKNEALMAVEVANLLTSLWPVKTSVGDSVIENDTVLFEMARANTGFSPSVFGSVVCFEPKLYRNYERFCPYAFRDSKLNGSVHVVDLAQTEEFDYSTSPNAIWWNSIRDKTRNRKPSDGAKETLFYSIWSGNRTVHKLYLSVRYEDGLWTRPYFDCFGGKVWMVTYLAPVLNETNEFLGTVSVDVSLKFVDINQCNAQDSNGLDEQKETRKEQTHLNTFMGTHRCKESTKCVPVPYQGFQRGTYQCACKRGYYFPDPSASRKYFYGKVLEEEYDKMMRGENNLYESDFECLACSEGCEECVDDRACVYSIYTSLRYALLVVNCLVILISLAFAALVYKYWQNKIFKASSPLFLEIIISGAIMMYVKPLVSFPSASVVCCVLEAWLEHVGFCLIYGSLALKTWRVVLIFRVRSARKLAITDRVLLKRLSTMVLLYLSYLTVWMVIQPPSTESGITTDKLKYQRCTQGWFGNIIIAADFLVLAWGMWLSFKVRKVPQVYNESRFISYANYNAMFIMCFMNVLSAVLREGSSPSVMYAIEFAYVHVTASVTLVLLFLHKVFLAIATTNGHCRTAPQSNILSVNSSEARVTEELETATLGGVNNELKLEIKRLAAKVAFLQSQLMTEQNRHVRKTESSRM